MLSKQDAKYLLITVVGIVVVSSMVWVVTTSKTVSSSSGRDVTMTPQPPTSTPDPTLTTLQPTTSGPEPTIKLCPANTISITSSPSTVEFPYKFDVTVNYCVNNDTSEKYIVVDILKPDYLGWCGKGMKNIGKNPSGTYTISMSPSLELPPIIGFEYKLKAWIVRTEVYDEDPEVAWKKQYKEQFSKKIVFT